MEVRAPAQPLGSPGDLAGRYRAALPFTLTEAQEQVVAEIDRDLARDVPMERLLQGDVGSGKTVVALYALLRAVEHGHQAALMAPTETLAEQHFLTVEPICLELGVRCVLVTSSVPGRTRTAVTARLASGEADLAVGTHALIQEGVEFRSLAVAVVDEQHRFGVEQRAALAADGGGASPHRLHMTATPIPRTLALTVWGDLAVSEITKPPAGRRPIVTRWITHERSSEAYQRLRAPPLGGPAGLRRLPARLAVGVHRGESGRGRGGAARARGAQGLPGRLPARAAAAARPASRHGRVRASASSTCSWPRP